MQVRHTIKHQTHSKTAKKTRAGCAEAFRNHKEKPGDINYIRRVPGEAILAENATEGRIRNALTDLRAKQSAYDKLKYSAASERKAQKEAQARAKREREQSDDGKKEQEESKNSYSSHSKEKKENKKQETSQRRAKEISRKTTVKKLLPRSNNLKTSRIENPGNINGQENEQLRSLPQAGSW